MSSYRALKAPAKSPRTQVQHYLYERNGHATLTAFGVSRRLYSGSSQFQHVEVWENPDHGKLLLLDGQLQSATNDEFIYHETLVHPGLARCASPRRALILGGGEGATLREVLRAESIEKVTMVDIDEEVVNLCRQILPEQSRGAFEDRRAHLVYGDARRYLEETDEKFDLIISDLTEPSVYELSNSLFSRDTFALIGSRLESGGVFTLQASEGSLGRTQNHLQILKNLKAVYPKVATLLVHISSFCCHWCFALASFDQELRPTKEVIEQRLREAGVRGLLFYDGETDLRLRSLPLYLRNELREL